MNAVNQKIKDYARKKGVYLWEIAVKLNIQDSALSRKLRFPLSDSEKTEILKTIDDLSKSKKGNKNNV